MAPMARVSSPWVRRAAAQLRAAGLRQGAARTVGLASVYRVLDTLAEHGLLQRLDVGDGVTRFEPLRGADHHHHLVCDDCGKVEAFADDRLEHVIRAVEQRSGYAVAAHDVVLRGACASCR